MKYVFVFLAGAFLSLAAYEFILAANLGTQVTATEAATILTQSDYRFYANVDGLTPVTALASENTSTSTPSTGSVLRLRMNIKDSSSELAAGATFNLQYSNSTSSGWTDLSTSTTWIFFDNPSVADGQTIVTTVLTDSDAGESYGESNPSAATPNAILAGQKGEWDWVMYNNTATSTSDWYFRMIYSSGTALTTYENYPKLAAVSSTSPSGGGGNPSVTISGGGAPVVEEAQITKPVEPSKILGTADLNRDGRIDIVDLSILLYHYEKSGPGIRAYDLNDDLVIDLADISILIYYWTS